MVIDAHLEKAIVILGSVDGDDGSRGEGLRRELPRRRRYILRPEPNTHTNYFLNYFFRSRSLTEKGYKIKRTRRITKLDFLRLDQGSERTVDSKVIKNWKKEIKEERDEKLNNARGGI